jgi:ATP-dependent Clp protease ATP-binding subunit ClpA
VFERFTEGARQVVVLAQDEARLLRHNYIGTEHILLGLLREREGLAARVLETLDITLEEVRAQVERIIGQGDELATGQIPFTPRAKKVLELALREALSLGHNYIGSEHLLLALAREGEGVAARILVDFDASPRTIAREVLGMLGGEGIRDETLVDYPDEIFQAGRHYSQAGMLSVDSESSVLMTEAMHVFGRRYFVLGWLLFAVALGIGLFVGWLIWS